MLWKSSRSPGRIRPGYSLRSGADPSTSFRASCVRPYPIGILPYMSGGHLPGALLALYTEILGGNADVP